MQGVTANQAELLLSDSEGEDAGMLLVKSEAEVSPLSKRVVRQRSTSMKK
jgi:hypothetical protein